MVTTPRKSRKSPAESVHTRAVLCDPDIVRRTFSLVTQARLLPFYILAAVYAFVYAPSSYLTQRSLEYCVFKVLPLLYLAEFTSHSAPASCLNHGGYCRYIILGLLMSALADGILAYDETNVELIICLFCVTHLFYIGAFYQEYKGSFYSRLIIPVNLILFFAVDYVVVGSLLSAPIVLYAGLITAMTFLALARLEMTRTSPAYLGWAGAELFILSDIIFALNYLSPESDVRVSMTLGIMTYYLAQLAIALSVHFC